MTTKQKEFKRNLAESILSDDQLETLRKRFKRRSNKITTRMKAYLEYVIHFYKKNDRARNFYRGCTYSPTINSPGCALGHLLPNNLCEELDRMQDSGILEVLDSDYFSHLPNWMLDFNPNFLADIQRLHDVKMYWSGRMLLYPGEMRAEEIYKQIENGFYN